MIHLLSHSPVAFSGLLRGGVRGEQFIYICNLIQLSCLLPLPVFNSSREATSTLRAERNQDIYLLTLGMRRKLELLWILFLNLLLIPVVENFTNCFISISQFCLFISRKRLKIYSGMQYWHRFRKPYSRRISQQPVCISRAASMVILAWWTRCQKLQMSIEAPSPDFKWALHKLLISSYQ